MKNNQKSLVVVFLFVLAIMARLLMWTVQASTLTQADLEKKMSAIKNDFGSGTDAFFSANGKTHFHGMTTVVVNGKEQKQQIQNCPNGCRLHDILKKKRISTENYSNGATCFASASYAFTQMFGKAMTEGNMNLIITINIAKDSINKKQLENARYGDVIYYYNAKNKVVHYAIFLEAKDSGIYLFDSNVSGTKVDGKEGKNLGHIRWGTQSYSGIKSSFSKIKIFRAYNSPFALTSNKSTTETTKTTTSAIIANKTVTDLKNTSVRINATVSPSSKVEKHGFYLGADAVPEIGYQGLATQKYESSQKNVTAGNMFFDVGTKKYYNVNTKKDEDIKLLPGTKYKYLFYIMVNGKEIEGTMGTFTTTGTAPFSQPVTTTQPIITTTPPIITTIQERYTITLNANGGTVSASSCTVVQGSSLYLPTPIRAGYTFVGWYIDETKLNNPVTVNDNATLTAEWIENAAAITTTEVSVVSTTTISTLIGASTTPATTATSPTSAPAATTIAKCTVTLNPNGGSVSQTSYTVDYRSSLTLPIPTRAGYTFTGWYTSNGVLVTSTVKVEGNATLTAQWREDTSTATTMATTIAKYTVTLNPNGGSVSQTSYTVDHGSFLTLPVPTREGYTFEGWYASNGKLVAKTVKVEGNAKLTAQWRDAADSIRIVTLDPNGGTVSPTSYAVEYDSLLTLPIPTREGYTFDGWYTFKGSLATSTIVVRSDGVLTARWTENAIATTIATTTTTTTRPPTTTTRLPAAPTIEDNGVRDLGGGKATIYCTYNNPGEIRITHAWYELWDSSNNLISSNINSPEVYQEQYQKKNPVDIFYPLGTGSKWYTNIRVGTSYRYRITIKLEDGRTIASSIAGFFA